MAVRTLTIRGITDQVLKALRTRAEANRRSLNSELLVIFDQAVAKPDPASVVRGARPASPEKPGAAPASLLVEVDRRALARLCRRFGILRLEVFGSVARGTAVPGSDVDVVVDFAPGKTPGLDIVTVADALAATFGGRRVDLVTRRGLNPRLRERILADSVLLYGS